MRRFRASVVGVEEGSIGLFSDCDNGGDMWTGDGPRERRASVLFSEPFRTIPVVQVSLSMWDTDHKANQRADVQATSVSEDGFTVVFRTWGDSRIARVRVNWLAIGELRHEDDWEVA